MPIRDRDDAREVEAHITAIFAASSPDRRAAELRQLFVETLDFDSASGQAPLRAAPAGVTLPPAAERIASLDGVHVCYVALDIAETDRVRKAEAAQAARLIAGQLGDDLLLIFTNTSRSQLHFIHPSFEHAQPTLRRMVVERDLPRRTAVQQVANIYWECQTSGSIRAALETAFDVEPVTKRFFAKYREVFEAAELQVTGFGPDEDEAKRLFVQTLFNRLMFVYFLSRKGWLAFGGDKDYLNALWQDYRAAEGANKNFYFDRLRLLFFAGLNNYRSEDVTSEPEARRLIGNVPFLNGGLFDMTERDAQTSIFVPDLCISEIFTKLFDRFNFTVMESTPFDIEVAVDPEMLGKVFEELVTGRHESGAYYTPRPVVSFMCREALKGYLDGRDTGLTAEAVERFVDQRDTAGISPAAAPAISRALDEITVVDPACGSGAYLLGMLQELVELQTTLFNVGVDSRRLHELKLHIIERNLYGVDIDEFAVNIAMLRLWLSLAIEYEGAKPDPLPNLDFKIVCGDSLLGPDPSPEHIGDLSHGLANRLDLGTLKADYMRAAARNDKEKLRSKITNVQDQVKRALGDASVPDDIVDWRIAFAEVFATGGGFDVVLANPPYGITVSDRRSQSIGNSDSYTCFMLLASEIAPRGVMAYITPTSWETGEGFKEFRKVLFGRMALQSVVNLPYDVFDIPFVDTAITVGRFGNVVLESFRLAAMEKRTRLDMRSIGDMLEEIDWNHVVNDGDYRIPLLGWAAPLFEEISALATPLDEITISRRGIEAYQFNIKDNQGEADLPFFDGQVVRYEAAGMSNSQFVTVNRRTRSFHKGPRILTRRLVSRSNRLMSARTDRDFVVKKDLYSLILKKFSHSKMAVILAILKSKLSSFLYLSRSAAATKDDFRQITLAGLRELPVVYPASKSMEREIEECVLRREAGSKHGFRLDKEIDLLIYKLYGVSDENQARIEVWLDRRG